jgi:pyroglutamyl-peptidase
MPKVLVTGFGPFPGAPFNPTGPLVQRLSKLRLPRTTIVTHIFETSYAAVDRDLPKLLKRHRPDSVLMFGLAVRARIVRIETRAQNGLARRADAAGNTPRRSAIAAGKPPAMAMSISAQTLLKAVRNTGVRARLSRDAGLYLCNYLCWHATAATTASGGPRLAAFVHVPLVAEKTRKKRGKNKMTSDDLTRAATAVLRAVVAAAERDAPAATVKPKTKLT